jgi:hypothetical protein
MHENHGQLQSLSRSVENTSLGFLRSLRNLRKLNFSRFSTTQPEELLTPGGA